MFSGGMEQFGRGLGMCTHYLFIYFDYPRYISWELKLWADINAMGDYIEELEKDTKVKKIILTFFI